MKTCKFVPGEVGLSLHGMNFNRLLKNSLRIAVENLFLERNLVVNHSDMVSGQTEISEKAERVGRHLRAEAL